LNIISVKSLSKSYGNVHALKTVSLEIPEGAVGLLGPNGAGKSTLLKILLGLARPTGGNLSILGTRVTDANFEILSKIGYMPEHECLDPTQKAISFVTQMARINGLPHSDAKQRAHEALHYVGIADERYRKIKSFSTGMRQKVKLAQAIAHDPDIIFLDEPTNGMDPDGRKQILKLIRDLHDNHNKSVIVSSHILDDIEAVCEHVIVLNHGKVVLQGDLANLAGGDKKTLDIKVGADENLFLKLLQKEGFFVEREGQVFHVLRKKDTLNRIVAICANNDIPLRYANQQMRSLEDIFLETIAQSSPGYSGGSKGLKGGR
jgi:ABC-2 type transport system ATP-binding protein